MICKTCGKEFERKYHTRQIYCSEECKKEGIKIQEKAKKGNKWGICIVCGKAYKKTSPSVYCSPECKRSFLEDTIIKETCRVCGKKFVPTPRFKKYCSDYCRNLAQHHKIEIARKLYRKENSLSNINALARERGLTYGKYVEMKERGLL